MTTTSSPTRAVLSELEGGATSLPEIAARTGLDSGVVSLAVARLVAAGYLTAERLAAGCPDGGCSTCPSGSSGRPGCGAVGGATQRGPVLISLGRSHR
jgi:hypothetical protein